MQSLYGIFYYAACFHNYILRFRSWTPKGKAWAVAIIDYGPQWDLQWGNVCPRYRRMLDVPQ